MAFRILTSDRIKRIVEALAPRFIGRDQDHLVALADEAADAGYSAAFDYTTPLYTWKSTIESTAGASDVGINDAGNWFTSGNVEGALQELGARPIGSVSSVFGRTGAVVAANGDYTFAQLASKPTTLAGYGIPASDVLTQIKTVDGTGSGLDADLLDGQGGAFYQAWANLTGKPTTISGYGITDTLTNTVFGRSGAVTAQANDYTFAQLASKPTTVSGYGITDAVTPTTLGTYGIGAVVTETDFNAPTTFEAFAASNGASNQPASGFNMAGLTLPASNANNLAQIACRIGAGPTSFPLWTRNKSGGVWNAWTALITLDYLSANYAALASPAFTGTPTSGGFEIGYRNIPLTVKNVAYTLTAADVGKGLQHTDTTARTYTVNNSVFSAGDIVTIINDNGTAAVTIAAGVGVTLYLAGTATTGTRTLAVRGIATLVFASASVCYVGGPGVT